MPQSSALRKEESAPAPTPITIDGQGVPKPKNAYIDNEGSVTFIAAHPQSLYFLPIGVFGDAKGHLPLPQSGPNGPYYPQQQNVTVSYCVTEPNTHCTPPPPPETATESHGPKSGGNTIKVG